MTAFDMNDKEGGFILRDLVGEPDDALLDKLYHRVLEPAFQPDELEPLDAIREQVDAGDVLRMQALFDAESNPVAVITSDWYAKSRVLLVGYLAVREDMRGRGIGTRLVEGAAQKWAAEPDLALALAEVEDPRYFQASDTGDPVARLRLYESLGARIIGVPYFQPKLSEESRRVHHLMLIAFAVNSRLLTEVQVESVPTGPIGVFLEEYFEATEGPQALNDPEFLNLKSRVLSLPEAPLLTSSQLDRLPVLS